MPSGDAIKKAKLAEDSSEARHRSEVVHHLDESAMEMEMGDSDEEHFIGKDAIGGLTPEEAAQLEEDRKMMEAMGFPTGFGTTKGKHVEGNDIYAAHKIKVRKVRQVINKKSQPKGGAAAGGGGLRQRQ